MLLLLPCQLHFLEILEIGQINIDEPKPQILTFHLILISGRKVLLSNLLL